MIKIIADTKESNSGIIRALKSREDVDLIVQDLEVGDYILDDAGLIIERKEATDFVNSLITDKRLFSQAENLSQASNRGCIIIEGDLFGTRSKIHPNALIGAISYLNVLLGLTILPSKNAKQTEQFLHTMARHAQEGLGYEVSLRGTTPKHAGLACQFLIEGLPGIGPVAAQKLLNHFGTPRNVMTAAPEEMKAVPGIGPKTIARIQELLDHEYS